MNSIFTIFPRLQNNVLLFDDADKGMKNEAFVSGADSVLIHAALDAGQDLNGFPLHFSESEFPSSTPAVFCGKEFSGAWYMIGDSLAWLCASTLKYFSEFPSTIYFQIPNKEG